MTADIQIIIVRWRHGLELDECLRSLSEHGGERLGRITVVDSGSGDGGADRLGREFPEIGVIALEANDGFASAADCGAREGEEPLILLLNPDTRVLPTAIDLLAEGLDRNPKAAGMVPVLEGMDGASQQSWQLRRLPTVNRLALGLPGKAAFPTAPSSPQAVAQPAAAAWLVRREVWDALGGLDPSYAPAWWEDVDFCARLCKIIDDGATDWEEGFVVQPSSRIRHAGGSSVAALGERQFLIAYNLNLLRYAARHHPRHLPFIRRCLIATLKLKGLIRTGSRKSYSAVVEALRTATPEALRQSPGSAAAN